MFKKGQLLSLGLVVIGTVVFTSESAVEFQIAGVVMFLVFGAYFLYTETKRK